MAKQLRVAKLFYEQLALIASKISMDLYTSVFILNLMCYFLLTDEFATL